MCLHVAMEIRALGGKLRGIRFKKKKDGFISTLGLWLDSKTRETGTVIKSGAKPISIDLFIERADNGTPRVTLGLYIYSPSLHSGLITFQKQPKKERKNVSKKKIQTLKTYI